MDSVSIGVGKQLLLLLFKWFPKMLKRLAKKIAPLEQSHITFECQQRPHLYYDAEASVCDMWLPLQISNRTLYDIEILTGNCIFRINGNEFIETALPPLLTIASGQSLKLHLRRPLTEFEYKRALRLLANQSMQPAICAVSFRVESAFGRAEHQANVQTSFELRAA
jgi:hypothetical protein